MRILISLLLLNSILMGATFRVRYIDPEKQKEYEKYLETNQGVRIPPEKTPLPKRSSSASNAATTFDSKAEYSSPKEEALNKSVSSSSNELIRVHAGGSSQITRTSSSSSSSLPLRPLSPKFSLAGWLWSEPAGWIYISCDTHPYYYSHQDKRWLRLVVFK